MLIANLFSYTTPRFIGGLNLMTLHFGKYLVLVTKLPVSTIVYWYLLIGGYVE